MSARRPARPSAALPAALTTFAALLAGCGPGVEDGQLPPQETTLTPDQQQQASDSSDGAAALTD